jgi:hypothetical protein
MRFSLSRQGLSIVFDETQSKARWLFFKSVRLSLDRIEQIPAADRVAIGVEVLCPGAQMTPSSGRGYS